MTSGDNSRNNNNKKIQCPICEVSLTVEVLHEYTNADPERKKREIEKELQLWGDTYTREFLIMNLVFCPNCFRVSHVGDWASSGSSSNTVREQLQEEKEVKKRKRNDKWLR